MDGSTHYSSPKIVRKAQYVGLETKLTPCVEQLCHLEEARAFYLPADE